EPGGNGASHLAGAQDEHACASERGDVTLLPLPSTLLLLELPEVLGESKCARQAIFGDLRAERLERAGEEDRLGERVSEQEGVDAGARAVDPTHVSPIGRGGTTEADVHLAPHDVFSCDGAVRRPAILEVGASRTQIRGQLFVRSGTDDDAARTLR